MVLSEENTEKLNDVTKNNLLDLRWMKKKYKLMHAVF